MESVEFVGNSDSVFAKKNVDIAIFAKQSWLTKGRKATFLVKSFLSEFCRKSSKNLDWEEIDSFNAAEREGVSQNINRHHITRH